MLITAIERQQAKLAKDLEERQLEAERKAEELLEELEKEIHELQTRSSELQHLELTQSSLHLLQVRFICCILPSLCCICILKLVLTKSSLLLLEFPVSEQAPGHQRLVRGGSAL